MTHKLSVIIRYAVMLILGVVLLVLAFINAAPEKYLLRAFCISAGIVLSVLGLINIILQFSLSEKKSKQNAIEESDERNVLIKGKAANATQTIIVPVIGIACFVLALNGEILGAFFTAGVLIIDSVAMIFFTWYYRRHL